MIPRGVRRPKSYRAEDFLRKDHVFLLERYFYFLEHQKEDGLLIFDETDKTLDRAFVGQVNRYFADTATGRYRAGLVVPVPVFVSSDMAYPVQAADVVVYVINWGYRRPNWVPPPAVREEIRRDFNPWLQSLLFRSVKKRRGARIAVYSIVRVGDPYESRRGA
jgi:hypothetical protein